MIVEDDPLIGFDLATTLEDAGALVDGPYRDAGSALAALQFPGGRPRPQSVILDVDLGGHTSEPVARLLQESGIPFVFHTGNPIDQTQVFAGLDAKILHKPANPGTIVASVCDMVKPRG